MRGIGGSQCYEREGQLLSGNSDVSSREVMTEAKCSICKKTWRIEELERE